MLSRIQQILKSKNLTPSKFAEEIGVQRSAMSHILSGRNNPSLEFIQKLLSHFPDIRTDWLLNGNGQMYKELQLFDPTVIAPQGLNKNDIKDNKPEIEHSKEIKNEPEITSNIDNQPIIDSAPNKTQHLFGKTINKIVIFYSDKSFSEYYPED